MDEKDYIMSDGDFLFNKSAVVDELKDIYADLDGPDDVSDINSIEEMVEKVAEVASGGGGGGDFTDISGQITLGGAWTEVFKRAWLTSGIVFYNIEAQPSSYIANYQYTMATIATGYRPRENCLGQGCTTDGGFSPKAVVSVLAQTNGQIRVNAQNNTGGYFLISGWYRI